MKKIAAILVVMGLMLALVPSVLADGPDNTTGDITITGTAATIVTYPIMLSGHTLDGTDLGNANYLAQPFSAAGTGGYNQFWTVTDPRGTGTGWHVDIHAGDFVGVSGVALTKTATIPLVGKDAHYGQNLFSMQLTPAEVLWYDGQYSSSCSTGGGCSTQDTSNSGEGTADLMPDPSDTFDSSFAALTNADQELLTAIADEGMGTYHLAPEFQLFVPAETYSGTYRADIFVTLTAPLP